MENAFFVNPIRVYIILGNFVHKVLMITNNFIQKTILISFSLILVMNHQNTSQKLWQYIVN